MPGKSSKILAYILRFGVRAGDDLSRALLVVPHQGLCLRSPAPCLSYHIRACVFAVLCPACHITSGPVSSQSRALPVVPHQGLCLRSPVPCLSYHIRACVFAVPCPACHTTSGPGCLQSHSNDLLKQSPCTIVKEAQKIILKKPQNKLRNCYTGKRNMQIEHRE